MGTVSKRALDPQYVNAILKQRAAMAGLESAEFSVHGLRSGYMTEAAKTQTAPKLGQEDEADQGS